MLTIDGRAAPATGSVLEACRAVGSDVPAFCHDPHLTPRGHCRSCVVEVDGHIVAACSTPARDGSRVETGTPRVRAYRRDLGELMRLESAPGGFVGATLARWGVDGQRYAAPSVRPAPVVDSSHPFIHVDLSACILCRRCERACDEVQGQFVFAVEGRGAETRLSWGGGAFVDTDCVSCGACLQTCPTGAIISGPVVAARPDWPPSTIRTTCGYCGVGCALDVHTDADRIVRVDGGDGPANHGHLCVKGRFAHDFVHHPDRLRTPLVRVGGQLVPATWGHAIRRVVDGLARNRGHVAGLSSSRATNEENYLFQKWMRAGLGTNDVDCCARVCHAPSAAGMREAFGTGAATNSFADIEAADLLLVVGANATEAHPVVGARIKQAALRGAGASRNVLIVIDPRRTELAGMADIHLQLRAGTNVALFNSLACVVVREGLANADFLARRVEGWEEYQAFIHDQTPERWESVTGVPAGLVREAARRYAAASRPMMLHGLGVTEHMQGSEGVMLLCNLALLVGAIGRPGVGVNPLRGQNNVQGAADMGCQPDLLPGYQRVDDPVVRAHFEAVWGRALPTAPGRTLPRMYDGMRAGDVRALIVFGEDVVQTDPDATAVRAALSALDLLVVIELFLSETAKLADVVLPGASFLEKDGTFTNGERRIQRVRKAVEPVAGRADWEVVLALMAATGLPQTFTHPSAVLAEIAELTPMLRGAAWDRLDEGLQWPVPSVDHPGTPILHTQTFPRGRGKLSCVAWTASPELCGSDRPGELQLVTGRSLAHYNSGSMTRRGRNVVIQDRDWLEMSAADAQLLGLVDGDEVVVATPRGEARAMLRVSERVAEGTTFLTFHFPETGTNSVTSDVEDRLTGCPEYKLSSVTVRRG